MANFNIGLSKFIIFPIITSGTSTTKPVYGTGVNLGAARELSLDADKSETKQYADNVLVLNQASTTGYSGTITVANVDDAAISKIWTTTSGTNKRTIYHLKGESKEYALAFEVLLENGKSKRYQLLRCSISEPNITHTTKSDTTEIKDIELNITASARLDLASNNALMVSMVEPASDASTAEKTEWNDMLTKVNV